MHKAPVETHSVCLAYLVPCPENSARGADRQTEVEERTGAAFPAENSRRPIEKVGKPSTEQQKKRSGAHQVLVSLTAVV